MATTELKHFKKEAFAVCASGTYAWVAVGRELIRYTLAGGAISSMGKVPHNIRAMVTDGTTVYIAVGRKIISYTIATGLIADVAKFSYDVMGLDLLSATLYVGLTNGRFFSVA